MNFMAKLSLGAIAAVSGLFGFIYSGLFNVSAMIPHNRLSAWVLSSTMHESVERRAEGINVPDLDNDEMRLAGINDFAAMCSGCHGAPGQEPEPVGLGLNPPAPDLVEVAAHRGPAEIFWVTKKGIRMTGMPAWGVTHDDDALWPVVAFIQMLPTLDRDSYEAMLARATRTGHHADAKSDSHAYNASPHSENDKGDFSHQSGGHPRSIETPSRTTKQSKNDSDADHLQHHHEH